MEELDANEVLMMQVEHIKDALDSMFKEGKMDENSYNKEISLLSYELAINGFPEECMKMLFNIKNDYFKNEAVRHFEQDEEFFSKCSILFEVLSYAGKVPYDILTTQKEGQA